MLSPVLARNIPHARREVKHTPLRDRALYECGHVCLRVPNGLKAARHAQAVEEACDGLEEVRTDRTVGDRGDRGVRWGHAVEDRERLPVAVGRGGSGELEHGRGWECHSIEIRMKA